ncbi:3-dehydroquinate synthase [Hyphomicrobium sp.]|uniref:3-dehydroquinate synthase n=1 Tax=Hyphomicrobium sp. TaxID=82 RepID=UPI002E35F42A|nr:3-dehydroquinate synthase [Hyphomicrobium sp.]HEX2841080.1 3-dehydroquinate synthase [Hyphomicrobium sp.]
MGSNARVFSQRFSVSYEFAVFFTRDVFSRENAALSDVITGRSAHARNLVAFVVDEGVLREMPDLKRRIADYVNAWPGLTLAGPVDVIAGGEAAKNDATLVAALQSRFVAHGMDRHSYVVCVGGGAVLDLVGYAAATTHRGIRHIRIPTTVLAQNDSGVGVKNGINAFGMKNMLGTFVPPDAVINDSAFIDVLPGRDKRAGMAEAVKVALIRDRSFFEWLEEKAEALAIFASEPLDKLIRHCALLHMRQIAHGGDPFERGSVRPLDFGHWAAHKLEVLSRYELRHGEAVAIGIALDTRYSVLAGLLPAGEELRVCQLLKRLGFALWHEACDLRAPDGQRLLLRGLEEFREHLGGELTITLLSELGTGVEVHTMDAGLIAEAVDWLRTEAHA